MNTSDSKISQSSGFTLIELVVAILILGLMISVGIPRLRVGTSPIEDFVVRINLLLENAVQHAITEQKVTKIHFYFEKKRAELHIGDKVLQSVDFPLVISLNDLYINAKAQEKKEAWFYITPDGISQEVIMNVIDTKKQELSPELGTYGLVLNPFTAQFKLYDTFQKPASA